MRIQPAAKTLLKYGNGVKVEGCHSAESVNKKAIFRVVRLVPFLHYYGLVFFFSDTPDSRLVRKARTAI